MSKLSDEDVDRIAAAVVRELQRRQVQQEGYTWPSPDFRWRYPTGYPVVTC